MADPWAGTPVEALEKELAEIVATEPRNRKKRARLKAAIEAAKVKGLPESSPVATRDAETSPFPWRP